MIDPVSTVSFGGIVVLMRTTLAALVKDRIETAYGGNSAAFARSVGISPQSANQLTNGQTTLPTVEVRRRLAKELGIPHIQMFVMAGELNREEAALPDDPRSDAVRRLQPLIDGVSWDSTKFSGIEGILKVIADPERETAWSREEDSR